MLQTGFIGGELAYEILKRVGAKAARGEDPCGGAAYRGRSKLEALFGPPIWAEFADKVVIDFGCGSGMEAIEIAQRGARRVIGIDIRQNVLDDAAQQATQAGVSDRCAFTTHTDERADVVLSLDGFEHYDDPNGMLRTMRKLLKDNGRVIVHFGPTWFHPYGGHLFSVFPWAHLLFTENALIRWRCDFRSDGASRFCEVEGGLNQMTIRRFRKLVSASDFEVESFEAVPIKRLRLLHNRLTREFFTSGVRCTLQPRQKK